MDEDLERFRTDLRKLRDLVGQMRTAQRAYWAERTRENLEKAKKLEADTDKLVGDLYSGRLF